MSSSWHINPNVLRNHRTALGLTQTEFARDLGISLRALQRIEATGRCSAYTFGQIVRTSGLAPRHLLNHPPDVFPEPTEEADATKFPWLDPRDEWITEPMIGDWIKKTGCSRHDVAGIGGLRKEFYGDLQAAEEGQKELPDVFWCRLAHKLSIDVNQIRSVTEARKLTKDCLNKKKGVRSLLEKYYSVKATVATVRYPKDVKTVLAHAIDLYLNSTICPTSRTAVRVAMSGGSTMRAIAERLTISNNGNCRFLEVAMPEYEDLDPDNAQEVVKIASKSYAPKGYDDLDAARLEEVYHAEYLLMGVGALPGYSRGMTLWERWLGKEDLENVRAKHSIVGDILYHPVGPDTNICPEDCGLHVKGLDIEDDLPGMDSTEKILIAGGADKAFVVAEAIKRNIVDHLVCDNALAERLVALARRGKPAMDTFNLPLRDYRPEYHYGRGAEIPFEELVLTERCYINLGHNSPNEPGQAVCRQCGGSATRVIECNYGPVRTDIHHWRVDAWVFYCDNCRTLGLPPAYVAMKIID